MTASPGNGLVLVVVDPRSTRAGADFGLRVSAVLEAICSSPPAAGQSGPVVPGDPENAVLETRSRKPFAIPAETWQLLERTGESLGLDIRPEPPNEGEDDVL